MGEIRKCINCGKDLVGKQRKYCSSKCENFWRNNKNESRKQYNKEYFNKYYKENKKEIIQRALDYAKDNKEKRKKYLAEYFKNNEEKINKRKKVYYENNKEKISKQKKQYREENKDKIKEQKKIYREKYKKEIKQKDKERYYKYREINKDKNKKRLKQYRIDNKEKIKEEARRYREGNREEIRKRQVNFKKRHEKRLLEQGRIRGKELRKNPIYRINKNMSGGIGRSLKINKLSKNRRHWEDIVGYTIQELKEHLEKLFKIGMSWNNYGQNGWHVDHIIPVSFFKFKSTDDVEFKMCWSLHNLQPLWEKDNLEKIDKMTLWRKKINARDVG